MFLNDFEKIKINVFRRFSVFNPVFNPIKISIFLFLIYNN